MTAIVLSMQLGLQLPVPRTWGGRRVGAGRKPSTPGARVPHAARPRHDGSVPVHITLRVVRGIRLRDFAVAAAIGASFRELVGGAREDGFRLVVFSLQSDHAHLIVEARDRVELQRGMRSLSIRLAKAVNRALHRRGAVIQGRYHAHALQTPTEVRNALVYVMGNAHKHGEPAAELVDGLDTRSSARWFPDFVDRRPDPSPPPVSPARTYRLRAGWKKARGGLLRSDERPSASAPRGRPRPLPNDE